MDKSPALLQSFKSIHPHIMNIFNNILHEHDSLLFILLISV
jgi:hypothetical protein